MTAPAPLVIDTDTNCERHLKDLVERHGVTAIGRYYAAHGDKRLTKTEAQAISDAGVKLFIVYEDFGNPELSVDRGRRDAQIAISMAKAIGQPLNTPVYFAMEHLPSGYGPEHVPGLKAYFEGIRRTFKDQYKVGCYSNGTTLDALLEAKLIEYAWVSASTAFHGTHEFLQQTDRWHLAQRKIDLKWIDDISGGNVSADTNDHKDDFGQWSLPPAEPATAVADEPKTEGDVVAALAVQDNQPTAPAAPARKWDLDLGHVNEMIDQGSTLAAKLRAGWTAVKVFFWGTAVTGTAAATFVNPNKGNAAVAATWGSQHPFLLAALCAGIPTLVLGGIFLWCIRGAIRNLVIAKKAGRYTPPVPAGAKA